MSKRNKNPVTGYRYSFGIHMGLSRGPVDEIVEIRVGDKTAWTGSITDSGPLDINKPELFGGDKQEGGIKGSGYVMMGKPDQTAFAALVAMVGHALPGFRRMCTYFFNGTIASNSPYPKKWEFRSRRALKGWENDEVWYPEKAIIPLVGVKDSTTSESDVNIKAMNPAHIILECMTNREWGRGFPISSFHLGSFAAVADTLFTEQFGMCLRWSRRDSIKSFIQTVLDTIGGVMYADRQSGLFRLKLIRLDYDPNALPIYTTDNGIKAITEADVSALSPSVNEVVVEYTDPISNEKRTKNAQNLGLLQATRGVFNSLSKPYPGVPTAELAARVAQRELRLNALALRRYEIVFDRRAWRIAPGDVIRISDPVRGITNVVVRIGRIDDGTLADGSIKISAVQDVFALPQTSFTGTEPPNWVKPNNKPILKEHRAFEVPYFLLNQSMTPADFDYLEEDSGFLGTVVAKPSDLSLAYNIFVKGGPAEDDEQPTT